MEILYCTVVLIISILLAAKHLQKSKKQLPPSPPALPIIGHFHLLKGPWHRLLQSLSNKYGPIMYLRLGSLPTIIVSSSSIAEECFTKNDTVFANRPQFLVTKHFSYNYTALAFSPYGDHWRNIRRVTTIHIFSFLSLNNSSAIWREEIRYAVQKLSSGSNAEIWKEVELSALFKELAQDVIMKMVCAKRWSKEADVFKKIGSVRSIFEYIPFLMWIGFGGVEKKAINLQRQLDKFLQDLVDEGRKNGGDSCSTDRQKKTLVQAFLSLQEAEPEYYTDDIVKGMIQIMFTAGIDTSISTMQWAMSLLLNHPEVTEKAKNEIDNHVTPGHLIEDSDLPKLPYLRCIVNETLRLFPILPFLLPHYSSEDCTINGYKVPKNTALMINAWAIHRDPDEWEEPTKFKPARFEGIEVGCEGFKFLPFGRGRRSCPGNNLAFRFVSLALGTLIQCFEWKRSGPEMVDFEEKVSFALYKLKPLKGLYRPRQAMINSISQL